MSPRGSERDRVANAATQAVGGGTAVDVETSDDRGEAYEVEVRTDDGTEIDVDLDKDLKVVGQHADDRDDRDRDGEGDRDDDDGRDRDGEGDRDDDDGRDRDGEGDRDDDGRDRDGDDDRDRDDRALSDAERAKAEKAALDAVGGGSVIETEAGDDRGEAYEVEVRDGDNTEWDVELDADHTVLHKTIDD